MQDRGPHSPRFVTGPQPALRLTFTYDGDQVTLVDRQRLEKVLPPSDPTDPNRPAASGFWFEVQDGRNDALYRLVRSNPIASSVEIPTGDIDRPFVRQDVAHPRGTFFLLVPDLPQARDVVLYSSPVAPGDAQRSLEAASELARFSLHDEPPRDPSGTGKERAS